jgi:hypothetical protein
MTATDKHKKMGAQFIELSELCHQQINSNAESTWMDEINI